MATGGLPWKDAAPPDGAFLGRWASSAQRFSFAQITDLHVAEGSRASAEHLRCDLEELLSRTDGAIDFIAATGDLTDRATEAEFKECRRLLCDLPLPLFPTPGNHDYLDRTGGEGYRRAFGPRWYAFDWGPVHFVVYDSHRDAEEGTRFSGREWLLSDLRAQPPGKPIILLTHYQLDAAFYSLVADFHVVASISGHWHSSRVTHDGRVTHFNGPSLRFGGIDYSPRAFRIFTW
ncbi:MAG TPA: metallophosphoesterase, partial [Limnochordia bacterium]